MQSKTHTNQFSVILIQIRVIVTYMQERKGGRGRWSVGGFVRACVRVCVRMCVGVFFGQHEASGVVSVITIIR